MGVRAAGQVERVGGSADQVGDDRVEPLVDPLLRGVTQGRALGLGEGPEISRSLRRLDEEEVQAAVTGVGDALPGLERMGVRVVGRSVAITQVLIGEADTEPTAVRAAAGAATASAFGMGHHFEVVYEGGWRCRMAVNERGCSLRCRV
nr:hypothetical protein GCM10020241_51420 [Streptoalloteichus tenebrarius]